MADIMWKYVKPLANKAAVENFEKAKGISLPSDLKLCITMNNGGRPEKNVFDTEQSKGRVFKTLLSFNESDIETIYKFFPLDTKKSSSFIPFASDPGGNFLCLKENKIVLFLHETDTFENVADSFTELLAKLYK
jgi:cell wall assembly regulator SMI1